MAGASGKVLNHGSNGNGNGNGDHGRVGGSSSSSIYTQPFDRLAASGELSGFYHHAESKCSGRVLKCCCAVVITFLCIVGVVSFVTWIALRPHKPKFYMESANVSRFEMSHRNLFSVSMSFNVCCRNANDGVVIEYRNLEAFLKINDVKVANGTLPDFFQRQKNTTVLVPRVEAHGEKLEASSVADVHSALVLGQADVELKMYARVRFHVGSWKSQHYKMRVSCAHVVVAIPSAAGSPPPPPPHRERCLVYF